MRQLRPNISKVTWKARGRARTTRGVGKWGGTSAMTWFKTHTQQMGDWGLKGERFAEAPLVGRGFIWNWNPGPLLAAPGFSLPIFQFLPMHCPNMPVSLAGNRAIQCAGWRWRGKGTAMFYPVILYNCVKLQKPFWLLISKWVTWKDWNQTFLVILRIA